MKLGLILGAVVALSLASPAEAVPLSLTITSQTSTGANPTGFTSLCGNIFAPGDVCGFQVYTTTTGITNYQINFQIVGDPSGTILGDLTASTNVTGPARGAYDIVLVGSTSIIPLSDGSIATVSLGNQMAGWGDFSPIGGTQTSFLFFTNVPEPLTLSLFGPGLAGMALILKRRRKVA